MKILTLLLLLIPLVSTGQNTDFRVQYNINGSSIDFNSTQKLLKNSANEGGLYYLGDGVYAYVKYIRCLKSVNATTGAYTDYGKTKAEAKYGASSDLASIGEKIVESRNLFKEVQSKSYNASEYRYDRNGNKILTQCWYKGVAIYQAYNQNGEKKYSKADALYHFKELKELLEIGIINKAEYEKKSAKWKKIYNQND